MSWTRRVWTSSRGTHRGERSAEHSPGHTAWSLILSRELAGTADLARHKSVR